MGKILIFFALIVCLIVAGCNTTGCMENQTSVPLAGFYSYQTNASLKIDSLEIGGVGAPRDSLLVDGNPITQLYLPFRSASDKTSFYIHYQQKFFSDPGYNDTITFKYESIPYFASEECGAMYRYRISACSYTTHLIDSVAVVDSLITNLDIERIRIYYSTRTDSE